MHDGMQYDPIRGQVKVKNTHESRKFAIFKGYLLPPFIMGADK